MKTKRFSLAGIILALFFLLATPLLAQQSDSVCDDVRFFPETGHNVCDQFLEFFDSRGDVGIFGYPITERFVENGRWVQYFQRVRMEFHPEHSPPYDVQLGLLGDFFAPEDAKAGIDASDKPKSNDPQRRYFSETGHTTSFGFLRFFDENGGLDIFGYPITEFMLENGRVVQYFQRALMEWDPNRSEVVLHDLGALWAGRPGYLNALKNAPLQLAQSPGAEPAPVISSVSDLRVTASVRNAFTGLQGEQTVWVYVLDQNGSPVEGAQVSLGALFLPGDLSLSPTDGFGHSQVTFQLGDLTPGQLVIMDVRVGYQGLTGRARTFFFCWW